MLFLSFIYFTDFTVIYAFNLKQLEASFSIQRVVPLDCGSGGGGIGAKYCFVNFTVCFRWCSDSVCLVTR